ncbi:MAG: TolC family protein [Firmicutes bacterium]|nr:TolC family protein [Bacillota bacterium]
MKRFWGLGWRFIVIFSLFQTVSLAAGPEDGRALTLEHAIEQALAGDLTLKSAKLKVEIADTQLKAAKRIIGVSGNYSISNTDSSGWNEDAKSITLYPGSNPYTPKLSIVFTPDALRDPVSGKYHDLFSLSCSPLDLSYEKGIKQQELNLASQVMNYESARIKLIADVRNTYYELLQKDGLYKLAQEDLELAKDHLRRTNTLFNIGKIAKLDLMDAEQQLKAAEAKLARAGLNYQAALFKLNILLGKDYQKGLILTEEVTDRGTAEQVDIEATLENTLKNAPEIKVAVLNAALAKIQALEDSTYVAKNIKIGISLTKKKDGSPDSATYSLSFSGPLDDTYFRDRKISKKQLEAAQLDLEVAIRNKQTLILESLRGWKMFELSLTPLRESLNIAKERLRIATVKYDAGMASGTELNQVRQILAGAEEAYWGGWLQLQQAREQFYQAVWDNPTFKQE